MEIKVTVRERDDRANLQLAYTCPLTGQVRTKSSGTDVWTKAERAAAKWELELAANEGSNKGCSWVAFRERFETEFLESASKPSRIAYLNAINHFEEQIGKPRNIAAINGSVISKFTAKLQRKDIAVETVRKILRHIRGALNWASDVEIISHAPKVKIPKAGKRRLARGRPLTDQEFERMLENVKQEVDSSLVEEWKDFLRFLSLSGLRISEAIEISWDSPPVQIDLAGRRPKIRWHFEGQKSRRDELTPIPPDLFEFLKARPGKSGKLFNLKTVHPKKGLMSISTDGIIRKVSAIGRSAEIRVSESKFASAHDLRRTFGNRWALKVHPIALKAMMRHATLETTMKYYVDIDADQVADEIWEI